MNPGIDNIPVISPASLSDCWKPATKPFALMIYIPHYLPRWHFWAISVRVRN